MINSHLLKLCNLWPAIIQRWKYNSMQVFTTVIFLVAHSYFFVSSVSLSCASGVFILYIASISGRSHMKCLRSSILLLHLRTYSVWYLYLCAYTSRLEEDYIFLLIIWLHVQYYCCGIDMLRWCIWKKAKYVYRFNFHSFLLCWLAWLIL